MFSRSSADGISAKGAVMKKEKTALKYLSYLFGVLTVICGIGVIGTSVIPRIGVPLKLYYGMIAAFILSTPLWMITASLSDEDEKRKAVFMKVSVGFLFAVYLALLASVLLLWKAYANGTGFSLGYDKMWLKDSLKDLIPFRATALAFRDFATGNSTTLKFFYDVPASMILYVPFAFFLPAAVKKARSLDTFLPLMCLGIAGVEVLQGMFGIGTCSVDDLILGALGALIGYAVIKIPAINDFFERTHLYF